MSKRKRDDTSPEVGAADAAVTIKDLIKIHSEEGPTKVHNKLNTLKPEERVAIVNDVTTQINSGEERLQTLDAENKGILPGKIKEKKEQEISGLGDYILDLRNLQQTLSVEDGIMTGVGAATGGSRKSARRKKQKSVRRKKQKSVRRKKQNSVRRKKQNSVRRKKSRRMRHK